MAKPSFGKVELNKSPDLSMAEITAQLFNNKFLSDVYFQIDGVQIYAHSWELMKRSVVFRNQLGATMGELKLIPIGSTSYDAFYQLIRFIYTDECKIECHNQLELLKLARKYKIIKLETKVINSYPDGNLLQMFEFCILERYDLIYRMKHEQLQAAQCLFNYNQIIESVHPTVMEAILKFDCLSNYNECEVFDVLMNWINKSCQINKIPRSQIRAHFDKFIRLIRFPTMTHVQFCDCMERHKDLFTDDDIASIFKQISLGTTSSDDSLWNSTPRLMDCQLYTLVKTSDKIFTSSFYVTNYITVHGLRFGAMSPPFDFAIQIVARDLLTKLSNLIHFKFHQSCAGFSAAPQLVINLGDSIELKPNFEYTVNYTINSDAQFLDALMRVNAKEVVFTGPPGVFRNLQAAQNLFEIIYQYTN